MSDGQYCFICVRVNFSLHLKALSANCCFLGEVEENSCNLMFFHTPDAEAVCHTFLRKTSPFSNLIPFILFYRLSILCNLGGKQLTLVIQRITIVDHMISLKAKLLVYVVVYHFFCFRIKLFKITELFVFLDSCQDANRLPL